MTPLHSLDLNITPRLHQRVQVAAAAEGMSFDAYLERALVEAVHNTEKHVRNTPLGREPDEYPYKCEYCESRFRLPMHRQRHVTWSHPDELVLVPEGEPSKQEPRKPKPEPVPDAADIPLADEEVEGGLKLAPGIDQALLDEFDHRYHMDVPRLD